MRTNPNLPPVERFWLNVSKSENCWLWTGAKRGKMRYGVMTVDSLPVAVHRISYEIENGKIPMGMCVLHICDTPLCVRPNHLWLGSKADNNRDKALKGRAQKKLTSNKAKEIRIAYNSENISQKDLGYKFNVSQTTIFEIVHNRIWNHSS